MEAFSPLLRQSQTLPEHIDEYTRHTWSTLHSLVRYIQRYRNGNRMARCSSCHSNFDLLNGHFWSCPLFIHPDNELDKLGLTKGLTRQQRYALKRARSGIDVTGSETSGAVCGKCMNYLGTDDATSCECTQHNLFVCYGSLCSPTTKTCNGSICCDNHCYCGSCGFDAWKSRTP